jgi:capsular polysaccharide biosynthesis protein
VRQPRDDDRHPHLPDRGAAWLEAALVVVVVAVALLSAGAALSQRASEYTASSRLVVTPLSRDNDTLVGLPLLRDLGDPIRTIETAAVILKDPIIAEQTAVRLGGGWTSRSVLQAVTVTPLAQTNVLNVQATAATPGQAAALADAYAATVLDVRRQRLATVTAAEIEATQQQLSEPGEASASTAAALRQRISQLRLLGGAGDPTIALAQKAVPPRTPAGTSPGLVLVVAGLAGLVLGVAGALLLRTSRTARRRQPEPPSEPFQDPRRESASDAEQPRASHQVPAGVPAGATRRGATHAAAPTAPPVADALAQPPSPFVTQPWADLAAPPRAAPSPGHAVGWA